MLITLTNEELKHAAQIALLRNKSQRLAGRADGKVIESSIMADTIGAEGELAVSKALGLPWDGSWLPIPLWDKWKREGNDVGRLEVRTTNHATGRLILHHSDKDNSPYILVISNERPIFRLAGWLFASEGKHKKYWATHVPRPCYMVKQQHLRTVEDLVKIIRN